MKDDRPAPLFQGGMDHSYTVTGSIVHVQVVLIQSPPDSDPIPGADVPHALQERLEDLLLDGAILEELPVKKAMTVKEWNEHGLLDRQLPSHDFWSLLSLSQPHHVFHLAARVIHVEP